MAHREHRTSKPSAIPHENLSGVLKLPLTQGKWAIFDADDWLLLEPWKWYAAHDHKRNWYVFGSRGRPGIVRMHRIILGALPGQIVDHANGDGLDNRRENIRIATASLNAHNRDAFGVSGWKGVTVGRGGRWQAAMCGDWLGTFDSAESAAAAYDAAARERFGSTARCNFALGEGPAPVSFEAIKCRRCRTEFTPNHPRREFCSEKCRRRWWYLHAGPVPKTARRTAARIMEEAAA